MEEEADWDLLAVVRGCKFAAAGAKLENNAPTTPIAAADQASLGGFEELQGLYKPFFTEDLKCPISISPVANGGFFENQQQRKQSQHSQQILFQQYPQKKEEAQVLFGNRASAVANSSSAAASVFTVDSIIKSDHSQRNYLLCAPTTSSSTPTPPTQQRSKKRKNLQKRVCHVPAEGLSSDMWAWRKYGQKPIKGSPYPRGYYRCSSSKGCLARKQVERNRSDPKMFIVTYTSEHNHPMPTHRNSLAGSTRLKPATAAPESAPPASSGSGSPTASLSPAEADKGEIKAEYDEEMGKDVDDSGDETDFKDMVMNDDFYVGFEELDDSDGGDLFPDQIQGNLEMGCPWMANNSSSTTTTPTTTTIHES